MFQQVGDKWQATIEIGDGRPPQIFQGDTKDDVIAELIKAQTHATKTIREQRTALKVHSKPEAAPDVPSFTPRDLSADERFRIAQNLSDPGSSAEAIRTAVEAELGASLSTVRQFLTTSSQNAERARCLEETNKFLGQHSEFKVCPENEAAMLKYMEERQMGYTAHNLHIAFEDLKDVLQLNTPQIVRPRSVTTTGVPARSSAPRPAPAVKLTVSEIHNMPAEEYRKKMSDPNFRKLVDNAFGASQ